MPQALGKVLYMQCHLLHTINWSLIAGNALGGQLGVRASMFFPAWGLPCPGSSFTAAWWPCSHWRTTADKELCCASWAISTWKEKVKIVTVVCVSDLLLRCHKGTTQLYWTWSTQCFKNKRSLNFCRCWQIRRNHIQIWVSDFSWKICRSHGLNPLW